MWQFWSFVVTDSLITEGRGFGETVEQIYQNTSLLDGKLRTFIIRWEAARVKKSPYMMGSTWYWVCMQFGSHSAIFSSPLSLKITMNFEKSSHVVPALTSPPSLKAERSHGDASFSKAETNSWASNSAPAAGFCSLEKESCAVSWQLKVQTEVLTVSFLTEVSF